MHIDVHTYIKYVALHKHLDATEPWGQNLCEVAFELMFTRYFQIFIESRNSIRTYLVKTDGLRESRCNFKHVTLNTLNPLCIIWIPLGSLHNSKHQEAKHILITRKHLPSSMYPFVVRSYDGST